MQIKCDMCLMPFSQDPGVREKENYCSYCYQNGAFTYQGDSVKAFQKITYQKMREEGISWPLAKLFAFSIRFAPHWKAQK